MTDGATWKVLDEYFERGLISKLEYIMRIKPTMLSRSTGGIALTPDENALTASGLPASPGIVGGKLVFRDPAPDKFKSQNYIFITEETTPDDFEFIQGSSGAVQLSGGMTCHLAVICRGLAKPAVVGLKNVRIDEKNRVLYCSGQAIPEFTDILLDGSSGRVILSGDFFLQGGVTINDNFKSHLDRFNKILSPLTDPHVFSRLPLEVQKHIANLKSRMRRVGLLT